MPRAGRRPTRQSWEDWFRYARLRNLIRPFGAPITIPLTPPEIQRKYTRILLLCRAIDAAEITGIMLTLAITYQPALIWSFVGALAVVIISHYLEFRAGGEIIFVIIVMVSIFLSKPLLFP